MNEERKDFFDENIDKEHDKTSFDDSNVNIYESKYTVGEREWFADDFEDTVKNAVPSHRALSVYRPKEKKFRKAMKNPVIAAVISSVLTCALCLSIFAIAFNAKLNNEEDFLGQLSQTENETKPMVNPLSEGQSGIPEVYDKASPSVVSILCKSAANNYMQTSQAMSSGSGIIISESGYVITNNHVIEGAASVTVTTIAGQVLEAKVVGADAKTDIAVLKVESKSKLVAAELGDSSKIRVGDVAVAIGNPLRDELAGTLTVGYISAINRTMVINGKQMTMIQTDAAINPGNSGGALLNIYGQVIGINTAKSTGYDVEGLGFAIPINEAKPIIKAIIENGYVTGRPLVGITGRTVTEAVAKANNLPIGVYVVQVVEYGAAERAGMHVGDVITECEGKKITTIDEINEIRDKHKPGDVITFKVSREGNTIEIPVTLAEEKPVEATPAPAVQPEYNYENPFPSDFFSWFGW